MSRPFLDADLAIAQGPNTVVAICNALSHEYGDSLARLMLIQGMTLADLITSVWG